MSASPRSPWWLALFGAAGLAATSLGQVAPDLAAPVRIKSGGELIDVTTGHAAPYVMDFDGDGVRDLLVGEFGDGEFPDAELPTDNARKLKGHYAYGRLRIYRNRGTNPEPRFEGFEYLKAGEGIATIPVT